MSDGEQSREEWEQEIKDVQRSITFPERLRQAQIISKRASATPAPIPDFAHLLRFVFSGVFLTIGFFVFSSDIPHRTLLGVVTLTAGCGLGVSAFRLSRKRS